MRASLESERVLDRDAVVATVAGDRRCNGAVGVELAGRDIESAGERRQGGEGDQDEGEGEGCAAA
jgi:hypothetical protein